jgi:hypothetical protein
VHSLRKTGAIVSQDELGTNLPAHSGRYLAWLGGANLEVSVIEQTVTVPPAKPVLQFWRQSRSLDECGFDYAGVVVNDVVVRRFELCTTKEQLNWQVVRVNLNVYAGKTVLLQFRAETNEVKVSSFFVDDVAWYAVEPSDTAESADVPAPALEVPESDAEPIDLNQ